ncbi:MAG: hypothetical protein AAFQ57_04000 [Cyanobacteria bacterium J06626_14]
MALLPQVNLVTLPESSRNADVFGLDGISLSCNMSIPMSESYEFCEDVQRMTSFTTVPNELTLSNTWKWCCYVVLKS